MVNLGTHNKILKYFPKFTIACIKFYITLQWYNSLKVGSINYVEAILRNVLSRFYYNDGVVKRPK